MGNGVAPDPPADLPSRSLPIGTLDTGRHIYRIHKSANDPKYFGLSGAWRFDAPDRSYGTLYAGMRPEASFAETLLRGADTILAVSELEIRSLCRFTVLRPLRLVQLYGRHLAALAANAAVTSGPYAQSQGWSRALFHHPDAPDGIVYRATHDNDELAVAIYEHASDAIDSGSSTGLMTDLRLLGSILNHYRASIR